ncbi:MAG: CsiV family protein [Pseudomonadota bacterium]
MKLPESTAKLITLLGLTACAAASAQEPEKELREYTVEVIVFSYEESVSVGTEQFLPDEPEPLSLVPEFLLNPVVPVTPMETPQPSVDDVSPDEATVGVVDKEFLLSPAEWLELSDLRSSLARRSTYRPLLHAAWTQDALPKDNALVIDLDKLTEAPESLSGQFTLYLSRFLHLVVDLEYERGAGQDLPVEVEWPGRAAEPLVYRIDEDRIFRSGETRYYDHPRFGVLARVTRVELPEEEDEALAEQLVN